MLTLHCGDRRVNGGGGRKRVAGPIVTLGKIIKKVFLFLEPPKIGRMMGEEKVKPF